MLKSLRNKKILVVVAHPDDELLGLGGTLHHLIKHQGCRVKVVILGEGITSRAEKRNTEQWKNELELHKNNVEAAKQCIGYHELSMYDFPDNRFDTVNMLDIVKVVEKEKKAFSPAVIFTHYFGDLNIDHVITYEAVMTACRPLKGETCRSIIVFETPSSTEWHLSSKEPFAPNIYMELDIKDINAKIAAMESYKFERRPYPHPRSPEALTHRAHYWGNIVGSDLVEPFILIRSIN